MVGKRRNYEKVDGICDKCGRAFKKYGNALYIRRCAINEIVVCASCYNSNRLKKLYPGRTREERRQMLLDTICYLCKKTIAEAPGKDKKRCNYKESHPL